jgi:hypothetical protein
MNIEQDLFISLGDVVRQTSTFATPSPNGCRRHCLCQSEISVQFDCSIMRQNVALHVTHLTTKSLCHQCPMHPAYVDGQGHRSV